MFGSNTTSLFSTSATSATMSPKLIMAVMGGCIGLLVIAVVVIVVYFVVVKSCGANDSGDSGGSGGGPPPPLPPPPPHVTSDVVCTKNTDSTYSCVANCAKLQFPSGSGCSAKLDSTTNICDITCSAPTPACKTDEFNANDPKTWVNLDSNGKCYGTAEVTGMVSGNTVYCNSFPIANGSYVDWATVRGAPKPSHLADGFQAVSGKASTTSADWDAIAKYCTGQAETNYPCTGLDIFYNSATNVSYYVPCRADRGSNLTPLTTDRPTPSANPFGQTVTAEHYGAVLAMKDFPGAPPSSSSSSSSMQSTLAKPSKRNTLPGW